VTKLDELAIAAASRRLDALASKHPELVDGEAGTEDNRAAWVEILAADEKGQTPMTPKASERGVQLAFRVPAELVERLDAHAERLSREHPGLEFTRTDAVRTLLTRALDEIEGEKKRGGRSQ
jgi:hypothetical protein